MHRAVVGILGRGAQGLLLAASVWILDPEEAADIALVLAACTAANVISNAGIPTLFVRYGRGERGELLHPLALAYICSTGLALIILLAILTIAVPSKLLATIAGVLLIGQSAFAGLEYWCLAHGQVRYDTFLRRYATFQALLAYIPTGLLLAFETPPWLTVLLLSASFLFPSLVYLAAHLSGALSIVTASLHWKLWWAQAASIGMGTLTAGLFYAVDVAILRTLADAETLANYRLAILSIAFVVGALPVNLLLLADVSAGFQTRIPKLVALALAGAACAGLGGLVISTTVPSFYLAGRALTLTCGLVAIRFMTQVLVSELNGRGLHTSVFSSYVLGLVSWVLALTWLTQASPIHYTLMAFSQTAVELVTLASLAYLLRYASRRRTPNSADYPAGMSQ